MINKMQFIDTHKQEVKFAQDFLFQGNQLDKKTEQIIKTIEEFENKLKEFENKLNALPKKKIYSLGFAEGYQLMEVENKRRREESKKLEAWILPLVTAEQLATKHQRKPSTTGKSISST